MSRHYPAVVKLVLPLPRRELSPNVRCHWAKKAAVVKRYRRLACEECLSWQANGDTGTFGKARIAVTFYWPSRRRRDVDNAIASLKPAFDGLRDAGLIADDSAEHLEIGPCRFEYDVMGRVELLIEREVKG